MRKPPRLVLRPVEPGLHHITVNGVKVGHIFDEWDDRDPQRGRRTARLYAVAGRSDVAVGEPVSRLRLRELRHALEDKLTEEGAWWT